MNQIQFKLFLDTINLEQILNSEETNYLSFPNNFSKHNYPQIYNLINDFIHEKIAHNLKFSDLINSVVDHFKLNSFNSYLTIIGGFSRSIFYKLAVILQKQKDEGYLFNDHDLLWSLIDCNPGELYKITDHFRNLLKQVNGNEITNHNKFDEKGKGYIRITFAIGNKQYDLTLTNLVDSSPIFLFDSLTILIPYETLNNQQDNNYPLINKAKDRQINVLQDLLCKKITFVNIDTVNHMGLWKYISFLTLGYIPNDNLPLIFFEKTIVQSKKEANYFEKNLSQMLGKFSKDKALKFFYYYLSVTSSYFDPDTTKEAIHFFIENYVTKYIDTYDKRQLTFITDLFYLFSICYEPFDPNHTTCYCPYPNINALIENIQNAINQDFLDFRIIELLMNNFFIREFSAKPKNARKVDLKSLIKFCLKKNYGFLSLLSYHLLYIQALINEKKLDYECVILLFKDLIYPHYTQEKFIYLKKSFNLLYGNSFSESFFEDLNYLIYSSSTLNMICYHFYKLKTNNLAFNELRNKCFIYCDNETILRYIVTLYSYNPANALSELCRNQNNELNFLLSAWQKIKLIRVYGKSLEKELWSKFIHKIIKIYTLENSFLSHEQKKELHLELYNLSKDSFVTFFKIEKQKVVIDDFNAYLIDIFYSIFNTYPLSIYVKEIWHQLEENELFSNLNFANYIDLIKHIIHNKTDYNYFKKYLDTKSSFVNSQSLEYFIQLRSPLALCGFSHLILNKKENYSYYFSLTLEILTSNKGLEPVYFECVLSFLENFFNLNQKSKTILVYKLVEQLICYLQNHYIKSSENASYTIFFLKLYQEGLISVYFDDIYLTYANNFSNFYNYLEFAKKHIPIPFISKKQNKLLFLKWIVNSKLFFDNDLLKFSHLLIYFALPQKNPDEFKIIISEIFSRNYTFNQLKELFIQYHNYLDKSKITNFIKNKLLQQPIKTIHSFIINLNQLPLGWKILVRAIIKKNELQLMSSLITKLTNNFIDSGLELIKNSQSTNESFVIFTNFILTKIFSSNAFFSQYYNHLLQIIDQKKAIFDLIDGKIFLLNSFTNKDKVFFLLKYEELKKNS
ncbi:MAG: hypothetical protein BGO10_08160 [Chlamydia sp. 32-24]|nr:MAG: hypothetical protein BGO10_08160 [Chlamydia sp. 32-24]